MKDIITSISVFVAILAISIIEIYALCRGINGVALSASIAAITALGTLSIKKVWDKRKIGRH